MDDGRHDRREFLTRASQRGAGLAVASSALPALLTPAADAAAGGGGTIVLTNATVIDATGAPPRPDTTVVVRGGRIVALAKTRARSLPRDARVVDARGKFVIPGLWDMHVHADEDERDWLALCIANGVTGIRVMWGFPHHHEWRRRIGRGTLLGPRMVIASSIIDGPYPVWRGSIAVGNEAEARQAVRTAQRQEHADFVKVYSGLTPGPYFAIADEARKRRIPFAGHIPDVVPLAEGSDADQRTFEHFRHVLLDVSSRAPELRRELEALPVATDTESRNRRYAAIRSIEDRAAPHYSPARAAALFAKLADNETWQCATLSVLRTYAVPDARHLGDPRLRYMSADTRNGWLASLRAGRANGRTVDGERARFEAKLPVLAAMRRAGVPLLAGTDTGNPYCFPGFSLHDELAQHVRAGLTPMQALQSATRDAARHLGRLDSLGTIAEGKIADLVLLDANPLKNIRNTRRIDSLVVGGRYISRARRAAILEAVRDAAARSGRGDRGAGAAGIDGARVQPVRSLSA